MNLPFLPNKTPVPKTIKVAGPTFSSVNEDLTQKAPTQTKLSNSTVVDLIAPESIEVDFDHLKIGKSFYRSLFVVGYPRFVSANWLSPVISFDSSMDVSMFVYPVESRDILNNLKRKIAEMEATIESDIKRGRVIDPSVQVALDDALSMQEQLAKGAERFFQFGLYITVSAEDLADLNQISKQVESTLASLLLVGKKASLQMEDAFKTTQPICVDKMMVTRNMDTTSLATTFPFTSSELTANEGVMYGINEHNDSLIIFDRFSMENANEVVLGKSGGGKSLEYNTMTLLRDSKGNVSLQKIGSVIDSLFNYKPVVNIEKDIDGIINPGLEVFTFDKYLKGKWAKVTVAAKKSLNRGSLYKITTKSGREITTTEDHNLIVLRKGKVRAISTQRVHEGEFLPLSRTLPEPESSLKDITPKDWVPTWPENLPSTIPLSGPLLNLMGLITSEGLLREKICKIFNIDERVLNLIQTSAGAIGANTFLLKSRGRVCGLAVNPVSYIRLFCALGVAGKSGNKRIPPILFNLSNPQIAHYLSAYFEGDGTVDDHGRVLATTKSKELASDLAYLLLRFGIVARLKPKFKRATNTMGHKGDTYYQLTVSGKKQVEKFANEIGFLFSDKQNKLLKNINERGNTNLDVVPTLGPIFQRIYKILYSSSEIKSPANLSPIKREVFAPSREELLKIIKEIEVRIAEIRALNPKVKLLAELPNAEESIVDWWSYKKHNLAIGHKLGASWRFMRAHPEAVGTRNFLQAYATVSGKRIDLPTVSQTIYDSYRLIGQSLQDYDRSLFAAISDRLGDTLYKKTYDASKNIWEKYKSLIKKTYWVERKLAYIKTLADSDLYWDEIISVEKLKTKEKYVYDLTVDNEVFLAGHGGMFIHNSFLVKLEALRSLMFGAGVIIIDPEEEYRALSESVGGDYISFSFSSDTHINPFDLAGTNDDPQENDLQYKIGFTLIRLLKLMVGTTDASEEALLHNALELTYRQKGITFDPATHKNEPPILEDLYKVLVGMENPVTQNLALRLEKFVKGSFGTIFNQRSNIKLNNSFTAFSFKNLEDQLRSIAIFIIMDFMWNSMKREIKKRILIVDEAWYLMKDPASAEFLWNFAKRARKYYLGLTTITQDIEDFLSTDLGKTVVTNSSIQILMKQSPAAIDKVAEIFYLSEGERSLLLSANVGEGLFFAGSSHVAMRVVASPDEYKLITTNPMDASKSTPPSPQAGNIRVA